MPSLADSAVIFVFALLLFGPKKLPELARQLGKLMAEFRRASNEFRMQMDEEMRLSEQAERQKKIAEMEAAAPVAPLLDIPEPEHPHNDPLLETVPEHSIHDGLGNIGQVEDTADASTYLAAQAEVKEARPEPLPIASSGELDLMPPATGLPVGRGSSTSLAPVFDSIPHGEIDSSGSAAHSRATGFASTPNTEPEATVQEHSEASLHG